MHLALEWGDLAHGEVIVLNLVAHWMGQEGNAWITGAAEDRLQEAGGCKPAGRKTVGLWCGSDSLPWVGGWGAGVA